VIRDIPTATEPVAQVNMMMNLGYIVKAKEIAALSAAVLAKFGPIPPAQHPMPVTAAMTRDDLLDALDAIDKFDDEMILEGVWSKSPVYSLISLKPKGGIDNQGKGQFTPSHRHPIFHPPKSACFGRA
jgi:hypothetical protein